MVLEKAEATEVRRQLMGFEPLIDKALLDPEANKDGKTIVILEPTEGQVLIRERTIQELEVMYEAAGWKFEISEREHEGDYFKKVIVVLH